MVDVRKAELLDEINSCIGLSSLGRDLLSIFHESSLEYSVKHMKNTRCTIFNPVKWLFSVCKAHGKENNRFIDWDHFFTKVKGLIPEDMSGLCEFNEIQPSRKAKHNRIKTELSGAEREEYKSLSCRKKMTAVELASEIMNILKVPIDGMVRLVGERATLKYRNRIISNALDCDIIPMEDGAEEVALIYIEEQRAKVAELLKREEVKAKSPPLEEAKPILDSGTPRQVDQDIKLDIDFIVDLGKDVDRKSLQMSQESIQKKDYGINDVIIPDEENFDLNPEFELYEILD